MDDENEETLTEKMGKDNYAIAEKLGMQRGDLVELIGRDGASHVMYFGELFLNKCGDAMITEEKRGLSGGLGAPLSNYTKIRKYTKREEADLKTIVDYLPKEVLDEFGKM